MAEQKHGDYRLTIEIAIAIVLAIVTALAIPWIAGLGAEEGANLAERAEFYIVPLQMGGEIFLRVLKMLVVPLVIASVMTGLALVRSMKRNEQPLSKNLIQSKARSTRNWAKMSEPATRKLPAHSAMKNSRTINSQVWGRSSRTLC